MLFLYIKLKKLTGDGRYIKWEAISVALIFFLLYSNIPIWSLLLLTVQKENAVSASAVSSVFTSNSELKKIINKTGKSFNWKSVVNGSSEATFETGTVKTSHGDIIVTKE